MKGGLTGKLQQEERPSPRPRDPGLLPTVLPLLPTGLAGPQNFTAALGATARLPCHIANVEEDGVSAWRNTYDLY